MPQASSGKLLSRIEGHLAVILRGFQYAGMSLVLVMMFLTVVHSVGRYIFAMPVPGIIEMSSFMLVTMIFLSIAYTQIFKGHVVIGLIVDRFSERTQAIIDSFTYLIGLVVSILAIRQTFIESMHMVQAGDRSMILQIPAFPFYFVVALGWTLFSLAMLVQLIHFVLRMVRK
ncbi:MAG: hypothetical protein A2144_04485 [Chloroflexi bacterium RBG_16_50_9]|nr:MAG: hypothetical protein A2144_04485 [Chloroflexi bacterium RBG_16_50_9]